MSIFISVLTVILLLVLLLLFTPITVRIKAVNNDLSFKVAALPFVKKRKRDKVIDDFLKSERSKVSFDQLKERIKTAKDLYYGTKIELVNIIKKINKTIKIVYYRGVLTVGFDDPMNTGVATGIAGTFCGEIDLFLKGYINPRRSSYLSTVPNFNSPGVNYVAEVKLKSSVFKCLLLLKELKQYKESNQESLNIIFGGNEK